MWPCCCPTELDWVTCYDAWAMPGSIRAVPIIWSARPSILDDPDGHGLELYRDRPAEGWFVDGNLRMANQPLDWRGILAEGPDEGRMSSGTTVGHLHLETHRRLQSFLDRGDIMADWERAVFMSRDRYHHHVAVNNSSGRSRAQEPGEAGGVLGVEIYLDPEHLPGVVAATGATKHGPRDMAGPRPRRGEADATGDPPPCIEGAWVRWRIHYRSGADPPFNSAPDGAYRARFRRVDRRTGELIGGPAS